MRLVLFGDLHLDTPFKWASPRVARARRQALRDTLDAIVDLALEVDADALCAAGDLYEHEMVAPDTGEVLSRALARMGETPVLMAPGNHDWLSPASVYARTEWSPNVTIFARDQLRPFHLADGFTVWGAAHLRPAGTPGFLDGFRAEGQGIHVALFHGSLNAGLGFQEEGKAPHAPFDADQIPAANLCHALVGHYHTPTDGPWHTYAGNPEPLAFGESGDRGVVVVDIDDNGNIHRTRHVVSRTVVHDITIDLAGATSGHEVRDRVAKAVAPLRGTVRATLTGEVAPTCELHLSTVADLGSHLDAFVPRLGAVTVGYDIDAIAENTSTVRGRFVRDVLDADLDDAMRRQVLVAGLRALDGRHDLEVV